MKHGNSNQLWRFDKDSIADQSAISLIIRATGLWNQMVCERLVGNKGILLRTNGQLTLKAVHLLKYILNKEYHP